MTAAFYQNETKFYVAVDCIILGFDQKELNVLLYKRKFEPMMGQWSLMGGFIKAGESIEEAASRVLTDCTGIDNLFMEQVGAYGDITRDLGERVISVAYYSLVNMNDFSSETLEEYNAVWAKVSEVPQLIFDHNQMITDTLARLRRKAATRPVGFNLLPEKFTLPQLQNLYEAIYQTQLDKRNFRKKLNAMDILEKLDEKDKKGSKRGAFYYMFNKEKYDHLLEQGFYFSLYYSLVNMNDFSSETLEEYNAVWAKVSEVPQLIFDHNQMITDTLARLRRKAATRPVGFNLLPEKFTLPQLQNLYEAIYQTQLDKRNFRKKLNAMDILEKLDEKDKKGSKRGAFYYMFNKEKYDHLLEQGFYFSL